MIYILILGAICLFLMSYYANTLYYNIFMLKQLDKQNITKGQLLYVGCLTLSLLFLWWVIQSNHTPFSILLSSIVIILMMIFIVYRLMKLLTIK